MPEAAAQLSVTRGETWGNVPNFGVGEAELLTTAVKFVLALSGLWGQSRELLCTSRQ